MLPRLDNEEAMDMDTIMQTKQAKDEGASSTTRLAAISVVALVVVCTTLSSHSLGSSIGRTGTAMVTVAENTHPGILDMNLVDLEERLDLWESWKQKKATSDFRQEEQKPFQVRHLNYDPHSSGKADPSFPIYLNTTEAYSHLWTSDSSDNKGPLSYSADYFALQQGLDAQVNQAYCAVATSVAVLNSLRGQGMELPQDPIYSPYPYATQTDVFNECTDATVIHRNATFDGILSSPFGLNLEAAHNLLKCHLQNATSWRVESFPANPKLVSLSEMRETMKTALLYGSARVMVNYDRATAGQVGGGHFSPIGAYNPSMDAFLVMDVAKYKYPNAWVTAEVLYDSISTTDNCGKYAGPAAQVLLPPKLLHPTTLEDMKAAMKLLHCQPSHRGFIIVGQA